MLYILIAQNLIKISCDQDEDYQLSQFVGKKVKIFMTIYNHMHLAEKYQEETDKPIFVVSKFLNARDYKFDDIAEIHRNGQSFTIKIGKMKICTKNNIVSKCKADDDNTAWDIIKQDFGYYIKKDHKCLTIKGGDRSARITDCLGSADQLFDFKSAEGLDACTAAMKTKDALDKSDTDKNQKDNNERNSKDTSPLRNIQPQGKSPLGDQETRDARFSNMPGKLRDATYGNVDPERIYVVGNTAMDSLSGQMPLQPTSMPFLFQPVVVQETLGEMPGATSFKEQKLFPRSVKMSAEPISKIGDSPDAETFQIQAGNPVSIAISSKYFKPSNQMVNLSTGPEPLYSNAYEHVAK